MSTGDRIAESSAGSRRFRWRAFRRRVLTVFGKSSTYYPFLFLSPMLLLISPSWISIRSRFESLVWSVCNSSHANIMYRLEMCKCTSWPATYSWECYRCTPCSIELYVISCWVSEIFHFISLALLLVMCFACFVFFVHLISFPVLIGFRWFDPPLLLTYSRTSSNRY